MRSRAPRAFYSSATTMVAVAAHCQRCWQGHRVPNKGYRLQPQEPAQQKAANDLFGVSNDPTAPDPTYVPQEDRMELVQKIMSDKRHMRTATKLDRVRIALDEARQRPHTHQAWKEAYTFLRTMEMCCELEETPEDVFPKGHKLWVELAVCEEKRVPKLLQLPNGMLVLPVFSMEQYLDEYFGQIDVFESCWFPIPRGGSQAQEFEKLPFPVCAIGDLQRMSMLATVALSTEVAILINPHQSASKFITYPEMVGLTEMTRRRGINAEAQAVSLKWGTESEKSEYLFDPNLIRCFDTSKMKLKRVSPLEAKEILRKQQQQQPSSAAVPPIALLELHVLMCSFTDVLSIHVRTVPRPRWRTLLGGSEMATQIDVVTNSSSGSGGLGQKASPPLFLAPLKRWSYLDEFKTDVHIQVAFSEPPGTAECPVTCVYRSAVDGQLLRDMITQQRAVPTVAESIGFEEPIVDKMGRKIYERHQNY